MNSGSSEVDVEHAAGPGGGKAGREDAHEAGKADQLDVPGGEDAAELGVELFARGIVPMRAHGGGDAGGFSDDEARGIGLVGEDADDLGRVAGHAPPAISAAMLEPRPEIRMATRFLGSVTGAAPRLGNRRGRVLQM